MPVCLWCHLRRRGRYLRYGQVWAWWRRGRYCRQCSPPRDSRAGKLAIAHNALITEVRKLHADVLGIDGPGEEVRAACSVALDGVPAVRSAWVAADDDGYAIWLLIDSSEMAQERRYYALVDPLYDQFPDAAFRLHVLNPRNYDELIPERIVPADAIRFG